jgi:hypothetical protein
MSDIEQRIRERAYRIWLDEGCPQRRELDHWDKATELVAIKMASNRRCGRLSKISAPLANRSSPLKSWGMLGNFPLSPTKARISILLRNPKSRVVGAEGRPA